MYVLNAINIGEASWFNDIVNETDTITTDVVEGIDIIGQDIERTTYRGVDDLQKNITKITDDAIELYEMTHQKIAIHTDKERQQLNEQIKRIIDEAGVFYRAMNNHLKIQVDVSSLRWDRAVNILRKNEPIKAGFSVATGAFIGYTATSMSGITAIGAVGSGIGFGSAAAPVGIVTGATVGLAIYGAYRLCDN